MSRKKIFGALFVVAVLVLAVLSSTVRSKVSLADERKYEELPQQENIYLSANKEQPQDAIEYQPMDSIELSSELELSPLGLPSDFSQEEIEIYKTVLQDFYDMQETIQLLSSIFYPISLRKTASTWKSAGTSCGCCGRRSACITASLLIPITTTCICSSCGRRYRRLGMAPPSGLTSTVLKISCALIWYEHLEIFMQIKSCVSVQSSYDRSVA